MSREEIEELLGDPGRFCGLAAEQTRAFVAVVRDRLEPYRDRLGKFGDQVTV